MIKGLIIGCFVVVSLIAALLLVEAVKMIKLGRELTKDS